MCGDYWDKCGFRDFKGKLLLPLRDFNIHYIEGDLYSRCGKDENLSLQVIYGDAFNPDPSRDGETLILRIQGFRPYLREPMKNKNKENEVSIWLTKEHAIKLKRFLDKMFPEKLTDFG